MTVLLHCPLSLYRLIAGKTITASNGVRNKHDNTVALRPSVQALIFCFTAKLCNFTFAISMNKARSANTNTYAIINSRLSKPDLYRAKMDSDKHHKIKYRALTVTVRQTTPS